VAVRGRKAGRPFTRNREIENRESYIRKVFVTRVGKCPVCADALLSFQSLPLPTILLLLLLLLLFLLLAQQLLPSLLLWC
jgi:hypothetical protein